MGKILIHYCTNMGGITKKRYIIIENITEQFENYLAPGHAGKG